MTTINNISDLARILQEQPHWAETLRSLLLTKELLELPEKVATLTDRVEQLAEVVATLVQEQARTNQRLDRLEEGQVRINNRLDRLEEGQVRINDRLGRMDSKIGNLEGANFERAVANRAQSYAMRNLGFMFTYMARSGWHAVQSPELSSTIAQARRSGAASLEELSDLLLADVIISDTEENAHAVFEASVTASENDIVRAQRRAAVMARITGGTVYPVVAAQNFPDPQIRQAQGADGEQEVILFRTDE